MNIKKKPLAPSTEPKSRKSTRLITGKEIDIDNVCSSSYNVAKKKSKAMKAQKEGILRSNSEKAFAKKRESQRDRMWAERTVPSGSKKRGIFH